VTSITLLANLDTLKKYEALSTITDEFAPPYPIVFSIVNAERPSPPNRHWCDDDHKRFVWIERQSVDGNPATATEYRGERQ
jgi:hypothetical protein